MCVLAGCAPGERVVDGKMQLRFGEVCYRIPLWNAELVHASAMPPLSGKRANTTLRLQFDNAALAAAIPGFHPLTDVYGKPMKGLIVFLYLRTPEQIEHDDGNLRIMHTDIWYGLDEYAGRVVEPIPGTSLYRVYPSPGSWMVVTERPDEERRDTHLSKSFWIGTCSFASRHDGAPTDERRCSTRVEVGELTADFRLREDDLALRDQVMAYVRTKLAEWTASCKGI